jgi:hypothetical protein
MPSTMPQTCLSGVVAASDPTDAQGVEFAMDHRPPWELNPWRLYAVVF